jgi:hypothetical protein
MKTNLAKSIWAHKSLVDKSTAFFSTTKFEVDKYSKFFDTHLYEKPEETDAEKKYRTMKIKQKKEREKQIRIKN